MKPTTNTLTWYVVYLKAAPISVYETSAEAEWLRYLLGPKACIKRFRSPTLLKLLRQRNRRFG